MKVKELKKLLDGLDDDKEILMSIDEEGNGYNNPYEITFDTGSDKYLLYPDSAYIEI